LATTTLRGGISARRAASGSVVPGSVVGTPLVFNLRTSQVGRVFWGLLIACGVVLAAAVARRVRQRIVSSRWRP
jgi:ABC-type spermidine/putrescine transport system permease subunit II